MKVLRRSLVFCLLSIIACSACNAQTNLIGNPASRIHTTLDGVWQFIIDPYETGFYDYRFKERKESDPEAYWNTDIPKNKMDRKEHGYSKTNTLMVPGDWNSQHPELLYYEGTVWYKRSFNYQKKNSSNRVFIYFGAVNYKADVYLNGKKLGSHKGGFTPFNFFVPDSLLKANDNFLVVKVDDKRYADEVPTLNTDWWNYGGITRSVHLIEIPAENAIENYQLQLASSSGTENHVIGWIQLNQASKNATVDISIPALNFKQTITSANNLAKIDLVLPRLRRWSPEDPCRYKVTISTDKDQVTDMIGFRTVFVDGSRLLVNGHPVFLRGISIHAEIPQQKRRAVGSKDARQLLGWAKELGCNMVRLAHYPHDEAMTRAADSMGLLVWSEIPVYWTIDFSSKAVLEKSKQQLHEMIARDANRASIVIWSVGNETPVSETRTEFMRSLLKEAREQDPTRLVSAALEVAYHSAENLRTIDDPLGAYVDIVAFNEYLGWYGGTPADCRNANWSTKYNKPLFISETGAEAVGGYHADDHTLWSEEFQEWYYKEQVAMLKRMPENFIGISPWILADFRSPRRNNPTYQKGWNNKGVIDQQGRKKKAFYVLREYYHSARPR